MKKATSMTKKGQVQHSWYLVDAQDKILGRLATKVATIIRGKHKPTFTPHVDCGDYVVVINAARVKVSGRKLQQKKYLSYSGYPGGQKQASLQEMLKNKPTEVIKLAVRRMLPRKPLYYSSIKKLKVYPTDKHPFTNLKTLRKIDI